MLGICSFFFSYGRGPGVKIGLLKYLPQELTEIHLYRVLDRDCDVYVLAISCIIIISDGHNL